jgi:hypothetical protein
MLPNLNIGRHRCQNGNTFFRCVNKDCFSVVFKACVNSCLCKRVLGISHVLNLQLHDMQQATQTTLEAGVRFCDFVRTAVQHFTTTDTYIMTPVTDMYEILVDTSAT